jgi:phosphatidylethanolamine/phosphatidyl-N-methylethanolamine N-methyltransferase
VILKAMAQHSVLLSIEINPHLHTLVSRIDDDRLIAHFGNANELSEILTKYGLNGPEVLISGIPFSTMGKNSGSQILETISSVLAPGGRFEAYQVSKRVANLCQPILGPGQMEVELINIPPLRVYRWEKSR